jgi:hypothetical protein
VFCRLVFPVSGIGINAAIRFEKKIDLSPFRGREIELSFPALWLARALREFTSDVLKVVLQRCDVVDEGGITSRVKQFITDYVESVMQLEVLFLLAEPPKKVWTANELAQQLRIDVVWVEAQLRDMVDKGLAAVEPSGTAFRYAPRTPELAATVTELAHAYTDRRVTVIGLIFSKPVDKIRSFADAFRLRKDRSDG